MPPRLLMIVIAVVVAAAAVIVIVVLSFSPVFSLPSCDGAPLLQLRPMTD